ncbi:SGNH/GDSL hydrolase family protein [Kutzneria kofuensis]|uniref:Lysophospholipase L1-like esterase n=1 Tax=Kutzneria kofuensis TaxID=103725 RepID=A0A7W9KM85_9PSEU|nr:SGNH/GDSL hydrolase family protein [Kutzneria kofuensis]MBB5895060.1 lysophospholipase L1-like esterase [Kutzneria kofuensis]
MTRRPLLAAIAVAATLATCATPASAATDAAHRLATWGPSMTIGGPNFANQTIRMVVHSSIAGTSPRITLSNLRGTTPLAVGAVDVAVQSGVATAVAGSHHTVTFSRSRTLTIAAGAEAVSDPIPMSVGAGQNLLVSVFLPKATSSATWHSDAFDTTFLSLPGDHSRDDGDGNYIAARTSWFYLSDVDLVPSVARSTVVAFGDSITDGYNTPTGAYQRWPDDLARRLAAAGTPRGVVDAGLGGNRVLTDVPNIWQGISALKRFGHDALGQAGVSTVILLEGINDLHAGVNTAGGPLTAADLIGGYQQLIAQAHRAGVRIIGGTIMPDNEPTDREAMRQAVNDWVRTGGAFDGVVDFDRAMADPANPHSLNPAYDSGDHLHPNATGMQAMANAVDLSLIR